MRLWIARHARPRVDPGLCYGALEVEADPAETAAAAARLAGALPATVELLVSPSRRCRQLAHALVALRPQLSWRTDPRLAEMDFGAWEGQRWDGIDRRELEAWTLAFADYRAGGTGECASQFIDRVGRRLEESIRCGRDQAWITHGGVFKALLLRRQGGAAAAASDWPVHGLAWGQWEVLDFER